MILRSMLIAIAVLGASACATAAQSGEDVRQAVTELVQRWSDAGEAREWDVVADTYADVDGFAWIEQGGARYTSRHAIVEGLNQARAMSASIRNDVSDIVVTPLGDDAAAFRAHYVLNVSAEGFSYSSEGVLSGVAIRHDGAWRFLQGSFSEQPPSRGGD
jgi:uncharacterized protein (TIGR02246 family)